MPPSFFVESVGLSLHFLSNPDIINLSMQKGVEFMEEITSSNNRPVNPRRRKRSKWEIFKEAYLPLIIVAVAAILILVFIIGSITRGVQNKKAKVLAAEIAASQQAAMDEEANSIIANAKALANSYDYEAAVAVIDSFTGNLDAYPELNQLRQDYIVAASQMEIWPDVNNIPNLSFHSLIVDAQRAFSFPGYESSNRQHYITTTEFSNILQKLYENNYILVGLDDIYTTEIAADGSTIYTAKTLRLPMGKKPIMLTQTNVNYYTYLSDTDSDKITDAGGAGFATKLVVGTDGSVDCEYMDADGKIHVGAYDLIPILDDFIDAHPDFSFNGAKAIISVTGYDGIFGYRTNPEAESYFGTAVYDQAVSDAASVANALKESGYELACYTYNNTGYGNLSAEELQQDVDAWLTHVASVIGQTDILVYAQKSDITSETTYSGEKFDILQQAGFRFYLGFCQDKTPWTTIEGSYVRQGRIMVTGYNLSNYPDWFAAMFAPATVLDSSIR